MRKNDSNKNKIRIILHILFALFIFLHALFFIVYWFSVGNFRQSVDQFISEIIHFEFIYIFLVMILTTAIGLWSLVRIVKLSIIFRKHQWTPGVKHWLYISTGIIFIGLFYGSFYFILKENPSQRGVLFHLFNLIRLGSDPLLFLLAGVGLQRLILYLRRKSAIDRRKLLWRTGVIGALVLMIGLWLLPAIFPPNWAYQSDLPAKPALIAHRGASMLVPENTLAAIETAAVNQAFGFETDLRISLDGVPFLMHDDTFVRTTNIGEIFPESVEDLASSFTLNELRQLNAGLWFIQKDPYDTIRGGYVSQTQLAINQGQGIPTLSDALALVKKEGMIIMFDMRYPPQDHPFFDEFFDVVLTKCLESGLSEDVWFLVEPDKLDMLKQKARQFTRVYGANSSDLLDAESLLDLGYEIVNVDTGIQTHNIQNYREKGLGVNVYTIDQPWLFSQFWLSGVTSVTTNNVHTLSQMDRPMLNIPYAHFVLIWGLFGIIVAIWLAASQPKYSREALQKLPTPDLMDFAVEDDKDFLKTIHPASLQAVHPRAEFDEFEDAEE